MVNSIVVLFVFLAERQVAARVTLLASGQPVRSAFEDDAASPVARFGTEIHDPVGALDNVHVVFDDHDRMPPGDQGVEGVEQLVDVVEMETRRRR